MTSDFTLSILMLAGVALMIGAIYLFRKSQDRQKAILMLIASLVMFANVAIWLIPTSQGSLQSEVTQGEKQ